MRLSQVITLFVLARNRSSNYSYPMPSTVRTRRVTVELDEKEWSRLDRAAKKHKTSLSWVIRQLILKLPGGKTKG